MEITKEGIEQLKAANELAAVVREHEIELKRRGKSLVGLCPFHDEKTPSFTLTPAKGLFHCFGCGASGDVIAFVRRYYRASFSTALEYLAKRARLSLAEVMKPRPVVRKTVEPRVASTESANGGTAFERIDISPTALLARVVEHYHKTFCEREDAQDYLKKRGLTDSELWKVFRIGYADGSLLKLVPRESEVKEQLLSLGILTHEGRELLGGCVVFPIPDPVSGVWTNLYGRGMKTDRHCYLPGPFRGVLNYQAARTSPELVLTESVIDALSLYQLGIRSAIPLYGTNGFTSDHLDLLLKSSSKHVVLCLDNDEPGRKAAAKLGEELQKAGIVVRVASLPEGVKDPNEFLASCNGDASEILKKALAAAPPLTVPSSRATAPASSGERELTQEGLVIKLGARRYCAKAFNLQATDRLRVVLRVESDGLFSVDALDLYAARSRREYAKRAGAKLSVDVAIIEEELLGVLTHLEAHRDDVQRDQGEAKPAVPEMTESERAEALMLLRRPDLLDQVTRDIDALGYVGEETNKRLLYLVAISRKLSDPLSAVILSQSGAGKSGLTEAIERLCPPEDVVLLTRLTPQSLYYVAPGFLDQKLIIVEERYGSMEADYSIRVLQSRKKLIAAAPVKDPQTGNLRTKVFTVEARAAFIEATTASSVNFENATRCFEITMDESAEQTRRIHERQRLFKTETGLELRRQAEDTCRRHANAQRLLQPLPVIIPYADRLTFPSSWMRTRRDHARFLNLIEVSAFLHQYQREQTQGAVLASLADYAVAYELGAQVLTETLSDVRRPLREACEQIRRLCEEGDGSVSRREIRESLAAPDSTVRRWLIDLVELEYLAIAEAGRQGAGKMTRYRLVERGPREESMLGLLTPEELLERLQKKPPFAKNRQNPVAVFNSK